MERGFKYRIYPNESQRDQIARTFGCCRFVYNRALDVKEDRLQRDREEYRHQ